MATVTQELADFVVRVKYDDLPAAVVHEAKRVVLDSLGCAVAGASTEKGSIAIKLARRLGGEAEAHIIGAHDRVSSPQAAFANGELINALDFDAILLPAIHVPPFVLPSALALGEGQQASGREIILAAVVGHEISCRVASGLSSIRRIVNDGADRGKVVWPPVHGYSANVFGSASAAGKLLGLDGRRMAYALGIAGYNAPMQASAQWQHSGTDALTKYASTGWIAQAGVTAAVLADMGYTGDASVLDGDHGFWRFAGSERWRPDRVVNGLGQEWYLSSIRFKLYPCCGIILGPLDCLAEIMHENHLTARDIEHIHVGLDPLSEMPLWQNRQIDNEVQAQFGVAYVMAVEALGLGRGVEWQTPDTRRDAEVRRLMERVSFATHPQYSGAALSDRSAQMARVEVKARERTFSKETSFARGASSPAFARASDKELEDKFRHNVQSLIPSDRIEGILQTVWELDKQAEIGPLMALLARENK